MVNKKKHILERKGTKAFLCFSEWSTVTEASIKYNPNLKPRKRGRPRTKPYSKPRQSNHGSTYTPLIRYYKLFKKKEWLDRMDKKYRYTLVPYFEWHDEHRAIQLTDEEKSVLVEEDEKIIEAIKKYYQLKGEDFIGIDKKYICTIIPYFKWNDEPRAFKLTDEEKSVLKELVEDDKIREAIKKCYQLKGQDFITIIDSLRNLLYTFGKGEKKEILSDRDKEEIVSMLSTKIDVQNV